MCGSPSFDSFPSFTGACYLLEIPHNLKLSEVIATPPCPCGGSRITISSEIVYHTYHRAQDFLSFIDHPRHVTCSEIVLGFEEPFYKRIAISLTRCESIIESFYQFNSSITIDLSSVQPLNFIFFSSCFS